MMDNEQVVRRLEQLADRAGRAAEARIERALCELHGHEDEYDGDGSETFAPFCGCMTCVIREVLDAAYPYLKEAARIEIEHGG